MAHVEDRWHRTVDRERVRTSTYGRGLRWRVRYRDPAGNDRSRSFALKPDAELFRAEVGTRIADATYVDPARGRLRVGELADTWLRMKAATRKRKTVASYTEVYKSLVGPTWDAVPVSRVEYSAVQSWVGALTRRGLSPSRVRQACNILRSILELAVKDRRITTNPARGVELPRIPTHPRHVYLTHGELAALADACGDYWQMVLLLGYAGLRWGEAIALRVRDVDELRQRVHVARTYVEVDGRLYEDTPKSHESRWVPVASPAWEALLDACAGLKPDALIFTSPRGGILRVSNFRRHAFDSAVAAIARPGLTPHDLRHTAASLAIASGATVLAVQRMLGQARASTTLDIYADLFETDLDELAVRIGDAAAAAPKWEPPQAIGK